jgi:4-amino-4-deoxy-L-arabinose transferase-like glycosyltransferase
VGGNIMSPAIYLRGFWPKRGLSAVLDPLERSHLRGTSFLILICLTTFLPGFFNIPPIDRDESRFVQATKQMLESADYVDIRFQEEVRYKEPVGIYWLQVAAVGAAELLGAADPRTSIWLYRLPSLLGATGAVLLTYWTALAFASRRAAVLAALMLACSLLLSAEARLAKTDAMLLLTVVAANGVLARTYLLHQQKPSVQTLSDSPDPGIPRPGSQRTLIPLLFWTALAGGVMLKGPLILMIVGLTIGTLVVVDRSARWLLALRPGIGFALFLLLVLPWFIAIMARSSGAFFAQSVGEDFLSKLTTGQETHGAPPGAYLIMLWFTFWPAAPLAALAAPAVFRERRDPAIRFLLAWLVPNWMVFELVTTKLPHYVLPLYPALAILIARVLERGTLSKDPRLTRVTALWPFVATILPIAAVIGVIVLRRQLALLSWVFGAPAIIFGVLAGWLYAVDGPERALLRATLAAQLLVIAVLGAAVPLMRPLFPSALLASTVALSCDHPQFAAAGYHEPSLVFLFGTATRLTDGQGAADFLGRGGCRYAFVEARQERAFVVRAEAIGLRYSQGPRIEAINYSVGHQVAIAVYRSEREE